MSSLSIINKQISETEDMLYSLGLQLNVKRNEIERLALGLTHLYDYMEDYNLNKSTSPLYSAWKKKQAEVCQLHHSEIHHSEIQQAEESPANNDQLIKNIRILKEKIREEKQTLVRLKKNIASCENELHYLQFERKRKLS